MLALLAAGWSAAAPPNAQAELERSTAVYAQAAGLVLDFDVRYTSKTGSVRADHGVIRREGERYFADADGHEIVYAAEGVIDVDRGARTIRFRPGRPAPLPAPGPEGVASSLAASPVRWLGDGKDGHCWAFDTPSAALIARTELCLDPATWLATRYSVVNTSSFGGTQPETTRIDIVYTRKETTPDHSRDWYSIDRYLSADRRHLVSTWAGYSLTVERP